MDVSSVHSPGARPNGPPPTMSITGAKVSRGENSTVVPTASPHANPSRAPRARSISLFISRRRNAPSSTLVSNLQVGPFQCTVRASFYFSHKPSARRSRPPIVHAIFHSSQKPSGLDARFIRREERTATRAVARKKGRFIRDHASRGRARALFIVGRGWTGGRGCRRFRGLRASFLRGLRPSNRRPRRSTPAGSSRERRRRG